MVLQTQLNLVQQSMVYLKQYLLRRSLKSVNKTKKDIFQEVVVVTLQFELNLLWFFLMNNVGYNSYLSMVFTIYALKDFVLRVSLVWQLLWLCSVFTVLYILGTIKLFWLLLLNLQIQKSIYHLVGYDYVVACIGNLGLNFARAVIPRFSPGAADIASQVPQT